MIRSVVLRVEGGRGRVPGKQEQRVALCSTQGREGRCFDDGL